MDNQKAKKKSALIYEKEDYHTRLNESPYSIKFSKTEIFIEGLLICMFFSKGFLCSRNSKTLC